MKKLNVAIVGYGRSGRNIHTHLLDLPELADKYNIVAYADADAQRREMIKAERGVPVYEDYKGFAEMKDQIDFVINASFSHHHASISKELMKMGFDVLSEKPAARDEEEFDTVLAVMKETGRRYFVFQQYRFSPSYVKINEIIGSGILGRIVQVTLNYDGFARRWDWQTVHGFTAGSLLNTGPHPVDHALAIMGFPQDVRVFAVMDTAHTYGDGEDYVKMILTAPGKPTVDIEISSCNAFAPKTFCVQGTRGTLYGDTGRLEWKYYLDEENPPQKLITEPLRNEKGEPVYCSEKLKFHTGEFISEGSEFDNKGVGFYKAFYETFVNGAPFEIRLDQIKLQMRVMGEAHAQNARLFEK
ncbi:MAG: Gfo/Idh/MocA family oxidoreductase [Clostridia bacterium]|nr:Gfo/Idh/MocA family oxidoreductase [Clostridia bacterium]